MESSVNSARKPRDIFAGSVPESSFSAPIRQFLPWDRRAGLPFVAIQARHSEARFQFGIQTNVAWMKDNDVACNAAPV
jgi:hypothetical protein